MCSVFIMLYVVNVLKLILTLLTPACML